MKFKRNLLIFSGGFILRYLLSIFIDRAFLPSPQDTITALVKLIIDGEIFKHLIISFYRVTISLILSLIIAIPLGIFIGYNQKIYDSLYRYVEALYPMPKVVFLPIVVLFFGLGNSSKIFLISFIIIFQLLLGIIDSVRSIPKQSFLSMYSLSQSFKDILIHLIIPYILPDVLTSLKISIGTAISVLFFSETFASFDGLGYFILDSMERREYQQMYATIILMSLMGLLLYWIVSRLENKFCHWKK